MKYIKITALSLSLVILSGLAFVGLAGAQSFKSGNNVTVAASETIDSMLFAGGSNIDIAGTVNGDVYCGGQTVNISGTINGDVFCAGQTININGKVTGDIRIGGQTVNIGGKIEGSATIGTQNLTIDNSASIGRDLLGGSQNATINGSIGRDSVIGSQNIVINGAIGRNVKGGVETITIGSNGRVGGNVDYYGTTDPTINAGGKIVGTTTRTNPPERKAAAYTPFAITITAFIYVLIAMVATALTLVGLFPKIFAEATANAVKKPGLTALVGIVSMIIAPVIVVMLFVTAIGVPLAVLIILLFTIIAIVSGPFVGYLLGRLITKTDKQYGWTMLYGVTILVIAFFIPLIGFVAIMASMIFGSGMILMQAKKLIAKPNTKK
ncbi:MAG: hypothetical protein WA087_01290 [Candidatus Saccharimonadales bacterium]